MSAALAVGGLNVRYGEAKVLFDVSFAVAEREILTCVGRNGAGKTTLLKSIAGLVKAASGSIAAGSRSLVGLAPHAIARLGVKYVAQDKRVFSDLTVRENMELGSYATRDYDWDRVTAYFPRLAALMDRKAGHLSGGERQMLMIGRALLGRPAVLLVDEPTEGLAPAIVTHLKEVFRDLRATTSLVIVEQNLPLVCAISDRIHAMKEGRLVAELPAGVTPQQVERYV
ncbi:MAG TPA: ABC transporter ATP-binding protein [Usitatibacter sp.]|nr:ABC transporter ATP-binding protein [Usitatibacter sp.]